MKFAIVAVVAFWLGIFSSELEGELGDVAAVGALILTVIVIGIVAFAGLQRFF